MSSLQQAQKLSKSVEVLDDVATRLRKRAAVLVENGAATFDDFRRVDEICDQVNAAARKLDAKVLALALGGLDEPLSRIESATEKLDEVRERIERLQSAIEIGTKLLLAALAIAALVVDPTRISAVAAAGAIASLADTIAEVAAEGDE